MFVIGVSGITCGGKTTLTQLLLKSFPWCQVIHQDTYFYDDDDPRHIRIHEVDHVNYEIISALDMKQMHQDVLDVLKQDRSHFGARSNGDAPNFEESGKELIQSVKDVGFDTTKYRQVPILLLEGFTLFGTEMYDCCDVRFFLSLTEEICRERRNARTTYVPVDTPGYFDKCIWPEYVSHFEKCILNKPGIEVIDGSSPIASIWENCVKMIGVEIEKKFPELIIK